MIDFKYLFYFFLNKFELNKFDLLFVCVTLNFWSDLRFQVCQIDGTEIKATLSLEAALQRCS